MPLDISVFRTFKQNFQRAQELWKKKNGLEIKIDNFTELLEQVWEISHSSKNIKIGFEKAGLWPYNPNWLEDNKALLKRINFEEISPSKINHEKFEKISNDIRKKYDTPIDILKTTGYLDLAYKEEYVIGNSRKLFADYVLDLIYSRCADNTKFLLSNYKPKPTPLGENPQQGRILNSQERIGQLRDYHKKKVEKQKKRKRSQMIEIEEETDEEEEEDGVNR